MIELNTPITDDDIKNLKIGDVVNISGTIYTSRDQGHKRIVEEGAPINLEGSVLFHAGPIIRKSDDGSYDIVAVGPTTSMRMNPYESDVLDKGVKIVIGKGGMDNTVQDALVRNNALYLVATGGCAALYVSGVKEVKGVEWLDLGMPEAMWELEVESFGPLIVAMDFNGDSLFK